MTFNVQKLTINSVLQLLYAGQKLSHCCPSLSGSPGQLISVCELRAGALQIRHPRG